jgi:HEAT repeat protein
LPVALNAELLHLLRINFFLDPPEPLPPTVEFEFLLSPLCREIDEGLYEIEPEIRDRLLAGLSQTYPAQRTQDIATLLWQYVDHHSPWGDRVELERAQQLTALNFLNPQKAQQWLAEVETEVSQGQTAAREWYVAMRQEVGNQVQIRQEQEEIFAALLSALSNKSSNVRQRAAESLGRIGSDEAVDALIAALDDPSNNVRSSAAQVLGEIGNKNAVDKLIVALQDVNSNVRASAAQALGQIASNKAVGALLKALRDKNRTVREMAVEALAKIGDDPASDASVDNLANELSQHIPVASLRSISSSAVWTIRGGLTRIGISDDNDLVMHGDPGVSRKHADIFYRDSADNTNHSAYFLRDFSRYGTWVCIPETGVWQKIHQQEILLPSGTQLKFGSSQNGTLEFSVADVEVVSQEIDILNQFQIELEKGKVMARWLDQERSQLAQCLGQYALDAYPEIKATTSPRRLEAFYFSLEQFLENLGHCLTWGRNNSLDKPVTPVVLDDEIYTTAFEQLKSLIPDHLPDNGIEQLKEYIDYLVESLPNYRHISIEPIWYLLVGCEAL